MNPHQRVSSPASQPSVRSRLVWLLVLLSALVLPALLMRAGVLPTGGALPMVRIGLLAALAWLLLWAEPGPFAQWPRPRTRAALQMLALPLVVLGWLALLWLDGTTFDRKLRQMVLWTALLLLILLVRLWRHGVGEVPEQVRERQRRVAQGAGVLLLLYGLALSALLIWALLRWR